jgi:hypothetical protein
MAGGLTHIVLATLFWAFTLGATYADLPFSWSLFGTSGSLIGIAAGLILAVFRWSTRSIGVAALSIIGALTSIVAGAFTTVYGPAIVDVSNIPPIRFRILALVGLIISGILAEFLFMIIMTLFSKLLRAVRG